MKFDVLLIPETKLSTPREFHSRWPDSDLARAREIVAGFPAAVDYVTSGMCSVEQTVKEVGPLTSVSTYSTSWWPSKTDTMQWWTPGTQSVIVLWESDEDIAGNPAGLTTFGGLGMGGNPTYATWALPDGAEYWWISSTFPQGAMVHEWAHGIGSNARALGFQIEDLHNAEAHGYTSADNWREWYKAYLSGLIPGGITKEVWAALGEGVVAPAPAPTKPGKGRKK